MSNITNIVELNSYEPPFADYGVVAEDYVAINEILDKTIEIVEVNLFENQSGEGVFILFKDKDDQYKYICTHAVSIVGKCKLFAQADIGPVQAKIGYVKSSKSNRMMYKFIE